MGRKRVKSGYGNGIEAEYGLSSFMYLSFTRVSHNITLQIRHELLKIDQNINMIGWVMLMLTNISLILILIFIYQMIG